MTEVPLFPLSAVLFPYGRMPLQIFEQRYLDLVRECRRNDSGFGVVWIKSGGEVAHPEATAPTLAEYGCYARIVDWDQLDSGLLGITVEGSDRRRNIVRCFTYKLDRITGGNVLKHNAQPGKTL